MKLGERTAKNVHTAFVGEAKANQRLLMFARASRLWQLLLVSYVTVTIECFIGV